MFNICDQYDYFHNILYCVKISCEWSTKYSNVHNQNILVYNILQEL
jgi:hypothetical protein